MQRKYGLKLHVIFFMLNNVFMLDGILVFITNHFQVLLVSFLLITSFYGPGVLQIAVICRAKSLIVWKDSTFDFETFCKPRLYFHIFHFIWYNSTYWRESVVETYSFETTHVNPISHSCPWISVCESSIFVCLFISLQFLLHNSVWWNNWFKRPDGGRWYPYKVYQKTSKYSSEHQMTFFVYDFNLYLIDVLKSVNISKSLFVRTINDPNYQIIYTRKMIFQNSATRCSQSFLIK